MNNFKVMMNGIIKENPIFVLLLGMCPTLGTTSSAINGMGMGLATMFVLICSNVVISSIKNLIPDIRDTVADDNASIRARSVCYPRSFHSADRSKLYRIGTCGSFRSEEQSAGFYV